MSNNKQKSQSQMSKDYQEYVFQTMLLRNLQQLGLK